MNQQWMTTLLSKGIELEQSLRKNFKLVQGDIKKRLEDRGIKLSPADLAALIEEISPESSRTALSYALDFMRPFSAGLGFRISKLTDNRIELVVPAKSRNQNENGEIHEGAVLTASIEASKLLWARHEPPGKMKTHVKSISMSSTSAPSGEVRVRLELAESLREKVLADLRQTHKSECELKMYIFDQNETQCGDLVLHLSFDFIPAIGQE